MTTFPLTVSYYTAGGLEARRAAYAAADPRTVRALRFFRRMREHGVWNYQISGDELVLYRNMNPVRRISVDSLHQT